MDLNQLGWDEQWEETFRQSAGTAYFPGRVCRVDRGSWRVVMEEGESAAQLSGKLRHNSHTRGDFPAVGDWVICETVGDQVLIHSVLPRRSRFTRKEPISGGRKIGTIGGREQIVGGATEEQVVAANIDTVLLVSALDQTFNLRRIEVYLTVAFNSGAKPVIVLNKADLCPDMSSVLSAVKQVAPDFPVHIVSAQTGQGMHDLGTYLAPGKTVALLGPSGAGKSSIINALSGSSLITGSVRESDARGRHTTTWRELILLPQGGVLVDTAGMRKLLLWDAEDSIHEVFHDIIGLAGTCRFSNCQHKHEPGCAVQQAIADGQLDPARLENFFRLQGEAMYVARRKKAKQQGRTGRPK